jgi:hypothetical protein
MRKLILKMSMTIDGFVGGPNGETGHVFKGTGDTSRAWTIDVISRVGLHIMGSKTSQDMASWWPTPDAIAPDGHRNPSFRTRLPLDVGF